MDRSSMETASRSSWKTLPAPSQRQSLEIARLFTMEESTRMMRGCIPEVMEDKWFIFFEEGWLYFHRSWTGFCIFGLRLENLQDGVRVTQAWVSRDSRQYRSTDISMDQELVEQLIATYLLA